MTPLYQHSRVAVLCLLIMLIVGPLSAQKKSVRETRPALPKELIITEGKASRYRILLPVNATQHEKQAGEILQRYVLQISGAALPIITASTKAYPYEIVIGQNERFDEVKVSIDWNSLREDGFVIRTDSSRLFIAGGNEKGAVYGVYTLLENYLGCRMYTPHAKVIPQRDMISLSPIASDVQIPKILFRDTHYNVSWDTEYTDWHKLDHDAHGNRPDWGMWVHTFNNLVPPDVHYQDHPEYFAMVKGKRIPTQLCLANKDVLGIVVQNLRRMIAANPTAKYWSVSQNDNRDFCTCDKCKTVDDAEGSPSGSIVQFVNQVADEFPDKIISTLAYEYGRHAPHNMKPRDNVNIMLCSIEAFRDQPIETDPKSADFAKDLADWGRISKDIIIWDYVIQFNNLVSPFPNLHVLQPNLQLFAKHGVTAMFEQGNREVGGEFAELRAYMLSKLMWNPDLDVSALMNDFLNGYYGAAGPIIRQYIDKMKEALLNSKKPLRIFGTPNDAISSYLTPELFPVYEKLFDDAEKAVAANPVLLERVRICRLPLAFSKMEQAKKQYFGDGGVFQKINDEWVVNTQIRKMIDPFTDLLIRQGVGQIKEWSCSPEEYRSAMYRLFSQGMKEHLGFQKNVTFISPDPSTLGPEASKVLVDGIRGSHDYEYNWMAFAGKDLEVVIDLGETKPVRRIESSFYQYGFWLKLLPKQVEYLISTDGKNYKQVGVVLNTLPIDQYGGRVRDFIGEFPKQDARYVKVKAYTIGNTPGWHPGAGRPAQMVVDEIVIE